MRTRLSSHGDTTLSDQRSTTFTLAALARLGPFIIFFYLLVGASAFVGIMATVTESQPRTHLEIILLTAMGLLVPRQKSAGGNC